jgi:hypothetical protein
MKVVVFYLKTVIFIIQLKYELMILSFLRYVPKLRFYVHKEVRRASLLNLLHIKVNHWLNEPMLWTELRIQQVIYGDRTIQDSK